jgi:acetoacetyl-CoA synthetase
MISPANATPSERRLLWQPSPDQVHASRLHHYQRWLNSEQGIKIDEYHHLWQWSVDQLDVFWRSIWDYFEVIADGDPNPVLSKREMPGAQWFPGTYLNYAEHVFRHATDLRPALIVRTEDESVSEVSWAQLQRDVGALAAQLQAIGIVAGDRVASFMPSRSESVVAFLACASIGAIWSSCSPDMGVGVVVDRFRQIEPRLLLAVDSYRYNGKTHDRREVVEQLLEQLPTVEHLIHVPGPLANQTPFWLAQAAKQQLTWKSAIATPAPLRFERVAFSHPLWIVYSSGTTGLPKAIVHSQGGIVLTHLKTMCLQHDLREGDRMMFLGSTGWIVWNLLIGGLLAGATIVLYDGNPGWPEEQAVWRFIDEQGVTLFGCGAAFITGAQKAGVVPVACGRFESLRAINVTGSPLPPDAFDWVYANIKQDMWLASISGGTDIASGFVACAPTLPVQRGLIQCRELGVDAHAFNEQGSSVVAEVGELVIVQPMPSMPLCFWGDSGDRRYRESYFEMFPGLWRHGDWIRFESDGTSVIYGRSDSTINRYGIRMGTAEIYRVVEELPEVRDSLVVDLEYLGRPSFMPLFVVLNPGHKLDQALKDRIAQNIRTKASARHLPNEIYTVEEIPRTLTGKKMEIPVRKLLLGMPLDKVGSQDAMANPNSLDFFVEMANKFNAAT